jgi:UDP-N-acetylmuramate dehydrogenase
MEILENKDLSNYTSFKIKFDAFSVFEIESEDDIWKIHHLAKDERKKLVILGEGTNTIFGKDNKVIVGIIKTKGIRIVHDFEKSSIIEVGAGENWDDFVKWSINQKYSGLECLSNIPGTVGASPVQNIGAYGQEIQNLLVNVFVFDRQKESFEILGFSECDFSYRNSIFKKEQERFIIYKVSFELKKTPAEMPTYKDLKLYFLGQIKPSARQIRNAVIGIREKKLPNYKEIPNCGSFFQNPFVDTLLLQKILEKHPKVKYNKIDENKVKLYAGWLVENINWEKIESKNIKLYEKNKLVLINTGEADFSELEKVIKNIQKEVEKTFGVHLEVEPTLV